MSLSDAVVHAILSALDQPHDALRVEAVAKVLAAAAQGKEPAMIVEISYGEFPNTRRETRMLTPAGFRLPAGTYSLYTSPPSASEQDALLRQALEALECFEPDMAFGGDSLLDGQINLEEVQRALAAIDAIRKHLGELG